jgi:hypothetical protein
MELENVLSFMIGALITMLISIQIYNKKEEK